MPSPQSRRTFLHVSSGVVVLLADCLNISIYPTWGLLNIMNQDVTVTTVVEGVTDAETVLSDTTTIV